MKFSLPTAIAIFCATTALAIPQTNNVDDLVQRDEGLDLSEFDIAEVELDSADFDILEARAGKTIGCSNKGKIKRVKKEYNGKCNPKNSRGFQGGHRCKDKGGKSYLCVQNNKATCYTATDAKNKKFENGECFK